jgi:hypothetical protein
MSIQLHAVQHIRKMRGGAQAHLMRASDGNYFVVKHKNNPQHVRVLANEMFASRLGQWLGLPIPRVEAIEVSEWLITHTPELCVELGGKSMPCSSGLQLASLYPSLETQVFDYLPEPMLGKISNRGSFGRALILDKWTANADIRQAIFTRSKRGGKYAVNFIDQGYCFNAGQWDFPDSPLRGVYARNSVYAGVTGWKSFEPALTRAEQADPVDLWRCAESIIPEWYEYDYDGLRRVVETLYRRRLIIRDLISAFRCSSRDPFPNWKEN